MSAIKITVNSSTSNIRNVEITRIRDCILVNCGTHSLARLIEEELSKTLENMKSDEAPDSRKIGFSS